MKIKLIFTLLIFSLTIGFIFINPSKVENNSVIQLPPAVTPDNNFIAGAMDCGRKTTSNVHPVYLNYNFWHVYTGAEPRTNIPPPDGWPGVTNDFYDEPPQNYAADVIARINQNTADGMRTIMERPKFHYTLTGQRSDYQAEKVHDDQDYKYYTYNISIDNGGNIRDIPDNSQWGGPGVKVKHCVPDNNQTDGGADWILSGLKANREQANTKWNYVQSDHTWEWYVMPKIRVDPNFVNNNSNWNNPVCSLEVLDWNGNRVPSYPNGITLYSKNFRLNQFTSYLGEYMDKFYFTENQPPSYMRILKEEICPNPSNPPGHFGDWNNLNFKTDYRVYWSGKCEMWIDYVRVENEPAHQLFSGLWDNWINAEIDFALEGSGSPGYIPNIIYREEFEFNCNPCFKYVNNIIKQRAAIAGVDLYLLANLNYDLYKVHQPDAWQIEYSNTQLKKFLVDSAGIGAILYVCYPLEGWNENDTRAGKLQVVAAPNPNRSFHPSTFNVGSYNPLNEILSYEETPVNYDNWLQGRFDNFIGGSGMTYILKKMDAMSKEIPGLKVMFLSQAHSNWSGGYKLKEPSNEEIDLMNNLAVSYGAKGIMVFEQPGYNTVSADPNKWWARGIMDPTDPPVNWNFTPRTLNAYEQPKYEHIKELMIRLKTWGPTMMSFDNHNRHSYIYRLAEERNAMYQNEYFYDIYTFKPGSGPFPCVEDFPEGIVPPVNTIGECKQERYLQVATFENPNELYTNYFMLVNRRCSPHRPELSENGGYRQIQVYFNQNANQLERYDNWKITDVENPANVITYVKGQTLLDFGWFEPGEGKLYKMEPVIRSGGILAGDENISGETFTCEAPVYNNGHNITIGANTTIHFNDSSRFVMVGGVFTAGDQNISAPQNITSDAVSGSSWSGHSFTNCEVKIYGATFTGLANDTTYAVNIIDCPVVDIRNCTFNTNSSLKGGVNAVFFSDPNNEISLSNIYIGANTFNSSGSTIPTVNISSYAGETTPLIIENNTFNEGNTAIFLSGITGGAIKGNYITDNFIGINALTSSIDIKSNTISSTVNNATGIFAAGSSELKMNNAGSKSLGGLNDLSNSGNTAANNIVVDGSVFLLDGGQNIFNITDDQSSKHLYGYFPQFTQGPFDETNNCFKLNSTPVDPPYNMVTSGFQGSQITFNFTPYLTGCEADEGGDGFAINLGDGIYDTIYNEGSGSGGSNKQIPLSRGVTAEGSRGVFVITTAKTKYDSISVLMRYRSYSQAKTKCLDLINAYPDSIQSLNAISKLFLSTVASDTSYNAVNELKIYYEDLILNQGYNTSLVKRANYYILKCKVRMREYSQALAGFQQIINQNPYSYEGLIARWDYMATSLLIQGQGGGEPSITNYELGITNNSEDGIDVGQRHAFDYSEIDGNDDDRSPFTKEQRQVIRKSINTAIEISKDEDDRKIKTLEVKSEQGDVNASKELEQIRSLKQVVKTEKPKSIVEHVRIVSEDIRKVFGSNTSSKGNEPKNIPVVFKLSQNYPNPFNPVTKINYDLPKDSKVKIVIYDILGREVKRLVNNELKTAGFYIVDFNASNYASGVYFYRIEAEEPNGNKFVDSKKMVLLK